MSARREVEIEAPPEDVWEALATERGRERWLEDEQAATVELLDSDEPHRLVWSWRDARGAQSVVEVLVLAAPRGSRVIVTESVPTLPLSTLAASVALVAA